MSSANNLLVSSAFYYIDSACRNELNNKQITSEDDYTSSFCTKLRMIDDFNQMIFIDHYSRKLDLSEEQLFGCDSMIIFHHKVNKVKICLFEAKWPRYFTDNKYKWDYLNKFNKSHYSDQLERQHLWDIDFPIWEMFYNESTVGNKIKPFDSYASNCVWHEMAYDYYKNNLTNNTWYNTDMLSLLSNSSNNYCRNLRDIILKILSCKKGKLFDVSKSFQVIAKNRENKEIKIPIPKLHFKDTINEFMERTGLKNIIYYKIKNYNDDFI